MRGSDDAMRVPGRETPPAAQTHAEGSPALSVIIPVFNEGETIGEIVARVRRAPIDLSREIIVVDDCSTDDTADEIGKLVAAHRGDLETLRHAENRGKGAAIRSG